MRVEFSCIIMFNGEDEIKARQVMVISQSCSSLDLLYIFIAKLKISHISPLEAMKNVVLVSHSSIILLSNDFLFWLQCLCIVIELQVLVFAKDKVAVQLQLKHCVIELLLDFSETIGDQDNEHLVIRVSNTTLAIMHHHNYILIYPFHSSLQLFK